MAKNPPNQREMDGSMRYINLLGGDYGKDDASRLTWNDNHYVVVPGNDAASIEKSDAKPEVHPPRDQVPANNYFFFKFAWDGTNDRCYDLSPFRYLNISLSMPPSADSYVTFTTKVSTCTERTLDSEYRRLSDFIPADNAPHPLVLRLGPGGEFARNWRRDGPNDFAHNKDITFVGMTPGAAFRVYRIALVGECEAIRAAEGPDAVMTTLGGVTATVTSAATTASTTATGTTALPTVSGTTTASAGTLASVLSDAVSSASGAAVAAAATAVVGVTTAVDGGAVTSVVEGGSTGGLARGKSGSGRSVGVAGWVGLVTVAVAGAMGLVL
ncbi:hypothetical protein HDU96_000650 [Phlyctochytrium bullatum]|nr:hypothetical protein HDU96_000650 [Phlyctochytrium bullatum]